MVSYWRRLLRSYSVSNSEPDNLNDLTWSMNGSNSASHSGHYHEHHALLDAMDRMAGLNYILMRKTAEAMNDELQQIVDKMELHDREASKLKVQEWGETLVCVSLFLLSGVNMMDIGGLGGF
jgi:hypothetical protein